MPETIAAEQVAPTRRATRWTSLAGAFVSVAMFLGGTALGVLLVVESMSSADAPRVSFSAVAFCAGFALIGLSMTWFYLAAFFEGRTAQRLPALNVQPSLPLLPDRPLRFARSYRASPVQAVTFLGACALFFAGLTSSQWPDAGLGSVGLADAAMPVFLGAMTGILLFLAAALVRMSLRQVRGVARPTQAWAAVSSFDVAAVEGIDLGNRVLAYISPFSSERVLITIGANEAVPWIVDGSVLVVCDEGLAGEYVVRDDGGPFVLSHSELARFTS